MYDLRRMQLTVDKDGFIIDTQQGMKVHIDNERVIFTGDSTDDLSLPADKVVELMYNIDLAYKLLIQVRCGDIEFNGQPVLVAAKHHFRTMGMKKRVSLLKKKRRKSNDN